MENDYKQTLNNFTKKLVTEPWLKNFEKSGMGWLKILSGSMAPLIQTGDQILVKKITHSHIHLGDIITFWQGNILVTHRVIRKLTISGEVYFVEKGDGNANYSSIHAQGIIGKVIKIKKSKREIDIDTHIWHVFNKIIGIALFTAYILRVIGRKTPFVPEWFKNIIRQAFGISTRLKDKILKTITNS